MTGNDRSISPLLHKETDIKSKIEEIVTDLKFNNALLFNGISIDNFTRDTLIEILTSGVNIVELYRKQVKEND